MSGSIDSQKDDVESSLHPIHCSTPSKKDNSTESPSKNVASGYSNSFESTSTKKSSDDTSKSHVMSGSIDSQKKDNVESSVLPIHSSTPSKTHSFDGTPRNVGSRYDNSFFKSSTSTRKSSDDIIKSRQTFINLSSTPEASQSPPVKCLSAWEEWLCRKEEEKRKLLLQLNEKRRQKEIENRLKEEKKLEKKLLAYVAHEKWLKRVENDKKRQLKTQRERAEQERILKEEKELLIKELAPQKYNDWKNRKDKLLEEKQKEDETKIQAKLEKLEEKKQLNEEAFNKWLKKVSARPKLQCSIGYGYAGGVLISYHDGTSSPRPSYCNPKPWVHCTDDKVDNN